MKTNEKLIAITAIVAILVAAMLMGCVEKDVPTPINNSEFKTIAADACDDIAYQLEAIVAAKQDGDFVTAKTKLAALDTSLVEYISIFEEMEVAENTLPCKKALISAFEETRILGAYFDAFLDSLTIEDYLRYGVQAGKARNQMDIAGMLAKGL